MLVFDADESGAFEGNIFSGARFCQACSQRHCGSRRCAILATTVHQVVQVGAWFFLMFG